jgi:hypothetical protein
MLLKRKLATIFAAATIIILAGSDARAQDLSTFADILFNRMDENRDGLVTKDEARASRGPLFDRFDADHDGFFTASEADAARDATRRAWLSRIAELRARTVPPPERFAELDQNGDAKVSRDEFMAGGTPLFDRFDHTGRGLSRADFAAAVNARNSGPP